MLLMLCVNDPDNGQHTGHLEAIEFCASAGDPEPLLKLEGSCVCRLEKGMLRISKRRFPVRSYTTWVGNWCWDGARVNTRTANRIANYLQSLGGWTPEEGEHTLFECFKKGQPIDFSPVLKEISQHESHP